jgi:hypothetical protein
MAVWHGTTEESAILATTVARNCGCEMDPDTGMHSGKCEAHQMMLDQRVLDGLLFERRTVVCLMREEFSVAS